MLTAGEVHVWRVALDAGAGPEAALSSAELAHADRLRGHLARERYLASHRALRAILAAVTGGPLEFAASDHGKPYLPAAPRVRFNLSHSHGLALVAAALDVEVGVDVEHLRPMPDCAAIAARFFPPSEAAALQATPADARESEFFRRWTRIEAALKAQGIGLHGAGVELPDDMTVENVEAGESYAAAVAAASRSARVVYRDGFW